MSNLNDYAVGWICALGKELVAARSFLDDEHEPPDHVPANDNNTYTLGRIGRHNVVIAAMPVDQHGLVSAATVSRDMVRSFPAVRVGLMVGIGGGAPSSKHDIRLGDVVVSSPRSNTGGVLQYDYGKTIQGKKFSETGHLNQPPQFMLTALSVLETEYESDGHRIGETIDAIVQKNPRLQTRYRRPDVSTDRLYAANFMHVGDGNACCVDIPNDNQSNLISREDPPEGRDNPTIHRGLIASANQLMKNALVRDKLSKEKDVLCFEMEAAGLMNHFPCLVIRGICDYSDTHKNDSWQGYAAMVAAAYARDLLGKIAPNKVEAERTVKQILDEGFNEVCTKLESVESTVATIHNNKYFVELKTWLSAPDPSTNLNRALDHRREDTGIWLLNGEQYSTWITGRNSFLWLNGISGCGKTILSSTIIKDLEQRDLCSSGTLYFYFDFSESQKQSFENMLRSLIIQLYCKEKKIQHHLRSLYTSCRDSGKSPSIDTLQTTLQRMIEGADELWIVLDALDERIRREGEIEKVLPWIKTLQNNLTNVHLLVTSRREHDIESAIEDWDHSKILLNIDRALVRDDICRYIQARLTEGELGKRWESQSDMRSEIEKALVKKADGMFRWVACQLDALKYCVDRSMVRKALKSLPYTLNETYDRILQRIHKQLLPKTIRILQFLAYSNEPLTINQLVDAIAVDTGNISEFKTTDRMPNPEEIMALCSSLVIKTITIRLDMRCFSNRCGFENSYEEEIVVMQLAHSSVKEYLNPKQEAGGLIDNFLEVKARASIAKVCIVHQLQLREQVNIQPEYEQLVRAYPLLEYATRHWIDHATVVESSSAEITDLVMNFLACEEAVELYNLIRINMPKWRRIERDKLHFAAKFGLFYTVQRLIDVGAHIYTAALESAVVGGHDKVVELLLENGADPKNLLSIAAHAGLKRIAEILLDHGADINGHHDDYCTPLISVIRTHARKDIAKMLVLHKNTDRNFVCERHGTPLMFATLRGFDNVVKLLLDHGIDINTKDKFGRTALHGAANKDREGVARLLIDRGADINAKDKRGRTALHIVANKDREGVARLLIDRGVDINAKDEEGRTALNSLSGSEKSEGFAKMLVEHGAEINTRNHHGKTSLFTAVEHYRIMALIFTPKMLKAKPLYKNWVWSKGKYVMT